MFQAGELKVNHAAIATGAIGHAGETAVRPAPRQSVAKILPLPWAADEVSAKVKNSLWPG